MFILQIRCSHRMKNAQDGNALRKRRPLIIIILWKEMDINGDLMVGTTVEKYDPF